MSHMTHKLVNYCKHCLIRVSVYPTASVLEIVTLYSENAWLEVLT